MKAFLTKAALYTLPDALARAMPFLILPITTRYLSLHDFGLIAIFSLCMIPFNVLSEIGTGYIINSLWFKYGPPERRELLTALLSLRFGMLVLAALIITPLAGLIYPTLIGKDWGEIAGLFPWFLLFAISSFVVPVFTTWIVMEGKAKQFALLGSLQAVAGSLVTLFTAMTGDFKAVIIGNVLVGSVLALLRFAIMLPHLSSRFNPARLPTIFRLGWPIFIRSAFNQVRTKFDKLYVAALFGGAQYAIYNWAFNVYKTYPTLESHLAKVFEPDYFKQLSEGRFDASYFRRLFFAWFYLVLAGSVAFYFAGQQGISLLTNGVFTGAFEPLLLFTCLALLGTLLVGQQVPIIHAEQTRYILFVTICSASVGLGSCFLLIPRLGINGAALSLFLMQIVTLSLCFHRRYKLTGKIIAEADILPYALAYWVLIGLRVFGGVEIGLFLVLLLGIATIHVLKRGGLSQLRSLAEKRRSASAVRAKDRQALKDARETTGP